MTPDGTRWQIPWVPEFKRYIIEPPTDFLFDADDDWMDLSFNTIREAMDEIDKMIREQPVIDSPVKEVVAVKPIHIGNVDVPILPPRDTSSIIAPAGLRQQQISEPVREYSPSEGVRGATPVDGQEDRLSIYARRVGLQ